MTPDSGAEASGFLSHLLETFALLVWPDDFDADHTGARVVQAGVNPSRIDGILIRTDAPVQRPERLWQRRGLHLLPAIDMTGTLGPIADLDGSRMSNSQADRIGSTVAEFHERRARVHRDLVMTDDSGEKLLARVYVSGRDLAPAYNDASAMLATYSLPLADKDITDQAEKLVREGFLKKRFFDRTHACGGCGSAHLNVREECPACGSAQLNEHAYVHHFPCAYQGPEGDFRAGDDLVCPKCRKGLRHFGHDYDRPGTMIICQDCGHSTSEPDVGFVCISCSSHAKADAVTTRDIHTYTMTEKGSAFCEAGRAAAGLDKRGFRFADLPLELVVALNEAARIHNDEGTPFSLIDIAYRNQRLIEREDGARMFAIVRDQFIENLRQALSGKGQVLKGSAYDFALLPGVPAQQLRHRIDEVISLSTQDLNADLGVAMTIFSPQDLF